MNLLHKILVSISLIISCLIFSQNLKKEERLVKGNCNMCKTRIESTAKKAGATFADWNAETKKLQLEFDPTKTSDEKILKEIANVGHDNELFAAPDDVYNELPGCCLYEREPSFIKNKTAHAKNDNQFFVRGNCGSCKARIEKAAKQAGAKTANWDAETQVVTLELDPAQTSYDAILKKIAEVGHDNEKYLAKEEVYNELPGCCLYDRELPFGEKSDAVHYEETEAENHSEHENKPTPAPQKKDEEIHQIEGVTVEQLKNPTSLSKKEAGLTFEIGKKELLKAACCNLSESFETNATVDVSFSNAVTGTKQLKMLGLDQKYTVITRELLPEIRGLATAYGLNFIPGKWIENIQLTKGGSTVVNGYESITGQINTELLKNEEKPETSLNFYLNSNLRAEVNLTSVQKLSEHWSNSFLVHGNGTFQKIDGNKDGFLDQPIGNQLNFVYLLNYNDLEHKRLASHFGIQFLKDERTAGQTEYNKNLPQNAQSKYGVGINISRFQFWNKTGYLFKDKPYQSLGWVNQVTYHQQNSFFGNRNYDGKETSYYSNLIFESIIGNTNNKYKTGASFLYDGYNENYLTENFKRNETVPGIFFEYTLTGLKYTLVAGSRLDFHNLAGTQFTPRLNFKYDLAPKTILRFSLGRGFRTANIFAENQSFFASNRTIEIKKNSGNIYGLQPEIAWNYGVSLQQEFKIFSRKSSIVADFFRTDFKNQVVVDLDHSAQKMIFYNLEGSSFANSFQTQWDFIPAKNLEVRIAYKYYNVQADYLDGRKQIPFIAKNRGFLNMSYSTNKKENGGFWNFDTTFNLIGKQRIPNTKLNPSEFQLPEYSNSFATLNAQISKNFNKKIRLYLGGENLTSYTQKNPILDAKNPFGNYFDGGMVYAPIMPANFYLGFDLSF